MKSTVDIGDNPVVTERPNRGFTLIEVLMVVAIIGIMAAIAYPSYQDSIRKGRRAEAKGALAETAARLVHYYGDNKTYPAGGDMTDIGYADAAFTTVEGFYQVGFSAVAATSFTLRAVPQDDQTNDTACATFTLTDQGVRGITGTSGVDLCW